MCRRGIIGFFLSLESLKGKLEFSWWNVESLLESLKRKVGFSGWNVESY